MKGTMPLYTHQVEIFVYGALAPSWGGFLRRGVGILLDHPVSVRTFMIDVLGMEERYATESVPGLFVNNAPVDDWRTEQVGDGDEIGMSGTMPGLCGIALRRASPIRAFRPDLVDRNAGGKRGGMVTLRMFNFIARECCVSVLHRGVVVSADKLAQYVEDGGIGALPQKYRWDGESKDATRFMEMLSTLDANVLLTVREE